MAAKRTKSSGPDEKDRNTSADQAEDTTNTGTAPDIEEAVVETVEDADVVSALEDAPSTEEDTLADEVADAEISESDASSTLRDDAEPAEETLELSGEDSVEPSEMEGEETVETDAETNEDVATSEDTIVEEDPAEIASEPQERVVERVIETRSVFVPAIIGGLVAAAVGFAAAMTGQLSGFFPDGSQTGTDTEVSAQDVAALRDQIATLEARLADLPVAVDAPDLSGIEAQITDGLAEQANAFAAADAALGSRLDDLAAQLTALAEAPIEASISDEAIAAYESELAAVQDALAQQRSEVEAMIAEAAEMEAEATESARVAQAQAAATRLFAALDAGSGFADEVTELQSLGVTVPEALITSADGLTSLGALQSDFPEMARTALAAARDETAGSGGFTSFLQRQLGARSVTPRDGDDPDAVLSRAEAALTQGDIESALSEIDALPDVARAALSGWSDAATARQAALSAADDLAQTMASN